MEVLKKPEECLAIGEVRQQIDRVDQEIIRLFAIRSRYVRAIVSFKTDEEDIVAIPRKNHVIEERAKTAASFGLDPVLFKNIFTLLVEENIRKELELFNQERNITRKSK